LSLPFAISTMTESTPVLVHCTAPWVRASIRSLDLTIGFSSTSRPTSLKKPRSIAAMSGTCPYHVVDAAWSSLVGDCAPAGLVPTATTSARTTEHVNAFIDLPPVDLAFSVVHRCRELHGLGRPPALEQRGIDVVHLDPQRFARRQWIAAVGSAPGNREIAAGAIGDRAEQVHLGEELEKVALPRRARLGEIDLVLGVEPGDLEDVEHVVDVELGEVIRGDRAREVVVARQVELGAVLQLVEIGVAPRAEQVVAASAR